MPAIDPAATPWILGFIGVCLGAMAGAMLASLARWGDRPGATPARSSRGPSSPEPPDDVWHKRRLEAAGQIYHPDRQREAFVAIERERLAWERGQRHRDRLEAIWVISAALRDAGADAPQELREALLEECRKLDAESTAAALRGGGD